MLLHSYDCSLRHSGHMSSTRRRTVTHFGILSGKHPLQLRLVLSSLCLEDCHWRLDTLRNLGPQPLERILSHWDAFAGPKAFEQLLFKALLFQAFQILPDETPDVIT